MRVRTFVILFAVFLILACSGASWAQSVQGVITGTITDPSGAVVPNATVTITNPATNSSQTTTTGSDGSYRFSLVPPGTYTVQVKAANFAEVRASGLLVEASQTVPFSIRLELAKASAVIEVTSQAPLVQTATSDLGYQVDAKTIENAALVDRDIFNVLPFMAPSVSPGLDMSPVSGGAREAGTSFMLNGAEDNNNFSAGAININPPLESVEDFTLLTNSMGAQYGRGAGALVSANQKSGANKLHGVVYEQNRNATLNANDFFYNRDYDASVADHAADATVPVLPKRPKYIKNQFGGAVGGPIKKDKTFFFFAYDRFKLLQGVTAANTYVPTSAALAEVQANGGPLAQAVLAAYPPVTSDARCPLSVDPGTPGPGGTTVYKTGGTNAVGCLSFSDPVTTTTDSYYGRVDHNFSNSDRLSFVANITRYNQLDKFFGSTFRAPLAGGANIPFTNIQNQHNLALIETHTFGPRVANELTFSHNRFNNPSIEGDPATQTTPNVYIDNQAAGCLNYSFGPGEGGQVVAFTQDRWALQDNLTWTVGRHALKIGGSANYGILYRNWDLGLPGQYEFAELTSISTGPPSVANPNGNSPCPVGAVITPSCDGTLNPADGTISDAFNSNFTGDYPYFEETSINPADGTKASAYRHYTTHDYAVFVQDDWKVTSRLTLNLGLRWERFGAPSETHNIIAQFTNLGGCDITSDRTCIGAARVNPVSRMWKTYNKDFAPRVGFAWDVMGNGKMAVRGGYGIFYDRIFDNIWSNGAWNPPFYALLDFNAAGCGDSIFYSNPASIGLAYDPTNPIPHPGKRVSVRTMDVNMRDSSGQNFYLGVERQFFGNFLVSAKYQGSLGRHLPMLENYNRTDGEAYNVTYDTTTTPPTYVSSFSNRRPNPLYTGFNYRSNSVSSNYNALIVEAQKRMGHGLQFQTGYTYSKLLDVNSELFAGCSTIGSRTAPYYYISNALPHLSYGRGAEDHRHAYKFNVTYEVPFFKSEKGFVGHALGGWSVGSFLQFYSGHPVDLRLDLNGNACRRYAALDASKNPVLDQNGIPFNLAGDYNMDGVCNDHPDFIGSSLNSVYSKGSPADGIFIDNNQIGCGFPGMPATVANIDKCNASFGVAGASSTSPGTPNALFANPAYPTGATPFERFGTLGRNVFHGPRLVGMDLGVHKTFKLTETANLRFSMDAQNLLNHPNFDGVDGNLNSGTFGQAQLLVGSAVSRVMSVSLRLAF